MTGTLTRADIADTIHRTLGISQTESAEITDAIIEEIISALERNEEIKLSSFGTFRIRQKKERIGRNPKTKIEAKISARKVVNFYPSTQLNKLINSNSW